MNEGRITREEIVDAENKLFAAQLASDVGALDQLMHDDLVAIDQAGRLMTKEMDLNSHRNKIVIIENASIEIEEVRLTGDTAASIVSMRAKGTMGGIPVEGYFKYLRIWKLFDDGLKIIGASFMQLS